MGGKTSTSTSQVSIPPEVLARYNSVNTYAQNVAKKPFQIYGTDPSDFVAQINEQQTTGINNINAATGSYQPYFEQARAAGTAGMASAQPQDLNLDKFYNPFQQQVIDATMKQMGQANEQAQSGALGTAASSGAFGGDRAGIAAANLANQQGLAMGSTLAGLNAQNYSQALQAAQQQQGLTLGATQADLARMMQGGQFMAGLGAQAQQLGLQGAEAQINAGTLGQQTEQAGKTALYNQFQQEQAYPFQVAQFLANIAMGTGALAGSTTTSTQPTSFFSDRRLKEDVQRIGKTDDGLPIYKFKYKGDDTHQTHVGFMADEVEQKKPEAVGLHPSGYKTVDYDKATRNSMGGGVMPSRAGQGFADGGVAGPYGSSVGSQPGLGGYVPQAYLPVGGLMVADPAMIESSNQNLAALMERSANFGTNLQKLEEQFGKDGSFWDMFKKQDEYASGGAAYLKTPSGGLAPNSPKGYLSDILENQDKVEKPELMTAQGGGSRGSSPASDIATLGKIGLAIAGIPLPFRDGGRAGYQAGGGGGMLDYLKQREAEGGLNPKAVTPATAETAVQTPSAMDKYLADRRAAEAAAQAAVTLGSEPSLPLGGGGADRIPATGLSTARTSVGPTIEAAEALPETGLTTSPRPVKRPETGLTTSPRPEARPEEAGLARANMTGGWGQIAPDIIARESGGDFDALYGFSNREGGPFEGVKVSDMTVDQAIDFSRPGGDYANWSKDKLGYTATPMGGLQIVGTTLRDIKEGMGLTGDEIMTPDLQMAMGEWLYNNRGGEQPWAASAGKGPAGAGGYSGGLSRSTSGGEGGGEGLGLRSFIKENAGNKDFLLSLLSGLGTMASSPSLYLGSALLQGIGGAANTYMAREQQRADITAKNLENLRSIAMDTMTWNEMNGANLTPAQYADMTGSTIQVPGGVSAQTILSGAYEPTTGESGLRKLDYQTFQNGVVDVGGRTVPMQNDPASLLRFINDNGFAAPDSGLGRQVEIAKTRLAEINTSGRIYDINGDLVVDPRIAAAADEQAQNDANRLATAAFREQSNVRLPQIPIEIDNTLKQASVFSRLEAGALTQGSTALAAMADALGLPVPEGSVADRAAVEEAMKYAAQREMARAESLGATEAQLGVLGNISATPDLQPEAVKAVITAQLAHSLREKDFYEMRDQWARSEAANGRPMDQNAYVEWFNQNEPYEKYYKEASESLPIFAGEVGSRQKPHGKDDVNEDNVPDGISEEQYNALPNGSYYYGTDGRMYGPKGRG